MKVNFNNCRVQHFNQLQNLKKILQNIPNDYLYRDLGSSVPESIAKKELEQSYNVIN